MMLKRELSSESISVRPSDKIRDQMTVGVGAPMAVQVKCALSPAMRVWLEGAVVISAAEPVG